MSERNLYRFMVFIIIVAIIKLLIAEDYGSVIALTVGLVPLIQDLRREAQQAQPANGQAGDEESE